MLGMLGVGGDQLDLECSVGLVVATLLVLAAYAERLRRKGAARYDRVDQAGGSALLGKGALELGYWAIQPAARACVTYGVSADTVSWASLLFAAAAGVSLAIGHFGVAAALSLASAASDALDGLVARATGTASDAGEVLDAAVDRYAELFFFGGLVVGAQGRTGEVLLILAASAGAIMVSYSTAKAEALRLPVPRGAMRRQERAVYLVAGAALVPMAGALCLRLGLVPWIARAPMLAVLALVAIVGNASAVGRLRAIARAAGKRDRGFLGAKDTASTLARDVHAAAGDSIR
jgi:CDP-diacylglycerol--glycerol-3-phosphate 3-phosphatidyltransferase